MATPQWYEEVDVVVIGSGLAGLSAAIEACQRGASVIVFEKMNVTGGNSRIADGGLAAPNSFMQRQKGVTDSPERFYSDMMKAGLFLNHPELVRVVSERAEEVIEWTLTELGVRYQDGMDVVASAATALGWFLLGAEHGSAPAMTNLGLCYEKAIGVPRNFDQAGSWYSRASKEGYGPAQFLLAQLFEHGRGTEKNPVFAFVNYSRAAASGLPSAIEARDALREKLTPAQIAEAEAMLDPKRDK